LGGIEGGDANMTEGYVMVGRKKIGKGQSNILG